MCGDRVYHEFYFVTLKPAFKDKEGKHHSSFNLAWRWLVPVPACDMRIDTTFTERVQI
jgi:hypothetical protein